LAITSKGGLQLIEHNQLKQRGINHRQRRGITALQLAQHYEVDHISARSLRQLQQQQSARLHYFRTTTQQHLQWGPKTMGTKSPGDQNHHQVITITTSNKGTAANTATASPRAMATASPRAMATTAACRP
jgi:hypothetical protein